MLDKITITCFAASYAVALALEASRIFFKSGVRGAVMLGFAGAGLLTHTLYLAARIRQGRLPLSSEFDWYLLAAWLLVLAYLYLTFYHPRNPIGIFLLPLVLALVLVAGLLASKTPFAPESGKLIWGLVHGGALLLGTVAGLMGFVTGLMYLWHASLLRRKLPPRVGFQLPNLEWLHKANGRAFLATALFVLCGFLSGLALSWLKHQAIYWSDPVVWTTSLLALWMAVAATFNLVYRPARQGRKVAYLTLATFVFLAMSLAGLLLGTEHARPDKNGPDKKAGAAAPRVVLVAARRGGGGT